MAKTVKGHFMKQRYLAIETSSPRLSLAVGDETAIRASFESALQWRHAESLFDGMQKVLRQARWRVQHLTGVAVCVGPGSFTGIRIGLAAARALGQTLRIPVVGISSLEIMANAEPTPYISTTIDALRGDVFAALFEQTQTGTVKRKIGEHRVAKVLWEKKLQPFSRKKGLTKISDEKKQYPDAKTLLVLARPLLRKAKPDSYKKVLPFYLRDAAAVERRS